MLSKIKKLISDKALLSLIFILLINLSFMGYFCQKKQTFFVDEGFSYIQSNGTSTSIPYIEDDELCRLNPPIFKDQLTVQPARKFTYKRITEILEVHPPLFYFIFHTINSFFPNHFTKWTGLTLNLIIFLLTQLALYQLAKQFLSPIKSLLPVIFYGFSVAAICTVVFIRNYMLLTLLTTLLSLYAVKIIRNINTDDKTYLRNLSYFCLSLFFGFLTHYYFLLTAFIFCAGICLTMLIHKLYKRLGIFISSTLATIALAFIIFPCTKSHLLLNSRGLHNSVYPTIKDSLFNHMFNLTTFNQFINNDFFAGYFSKDCHLFIWLITLILICVMYELIRDLKAKAVILLPTITFILSVLAISTVLPFDIFFSGVAKRYFFHLAPLFALLFVLCLDSLTQFVKKNEILQLVLIVVMLTATLQKPDFQVYFKTENTPENHYVTQIREKTLFIKISEPHQDWHMLETALYAFSAKNFIIFRNYTDSCFQNMLKNKTSQKQSALLIENTGIKEDTCPVLKDYNLRFWDWSVCAYLPKE